MGEIKRLVAMIHNLLDLLETKRNQSLVNQIRGLLYEISDLLTKV